MCVIIFWLKWAFHRAAVQILEGRYIDRTQPEKGRFTRTQVKRLLARTWLNLEELLPNANLDQQETLGNRQNVFLAAATHAAYRTFLNSGIEAEYAIELISDIAWKVYASWLALPSFLAKIVSNDRQKQMNLILRIYLIYPFSQPGYQRKVREADNGFHTHWFRCPPYEYFKKNGDENEIKVFNRIWCQFDWAVAQAMVAGGKYERPHTLSAGDTVCDMRWYVEENQSKKSEGEKQNEFQAT